MVCRQAEYSLKRSMPRFSEFLNKVWGLEGCSPFLPPAYESLSQVWFRRVYRAVGFTIQVNYKKYGAVMAELRTKFPSCTNFVIIEIDWEA